MWYRRFKGDYPRKDKPEGVRELEKVSSAHHITEVCCGAGLSCWVNNKPCFGVKVGGCHQNRHGHPAGRGRTSSESMAGGPLVFIRDSYGMLIARLRP